MEIKITDILDTSIRGVTVRDCRTCEAYKENWFAWTAFPVVTAFQTTEIISGLLEGWHHTPNFSCVEYHADKEQFYFISGTCLMLFIDIVDGKPDPATAQMVRIPAGVELEIDAGKAHFVGVAEDERFQAIVVSPVQGAPRMDLPEEIKGV